MWSIRAMTLPLIARLAGSVARRANVTKDAPVAVTLATSVTLPARRARRNIWFLGGLFAAIAAPAAADTLLIRPARLFDGSAIHTGWSVLVDGDRIAAVGPGVAAPASTRTIDLPNATLLPGMI